MVVFIDDEKWLIQAYIDELELKSKSDISFEPKHFFYAKEALEFLNKNKENINLLVVDIGMDFGDGDLTNNVHGGIQFLEELQKDDRLKKIPVIILTVYDKEIDNDNFPFKNNPLITIIGRGNSDRDNVFWKTVNYYVK